MTPREALEDAREALLKAYREGSESHHHALWVEIYADSLVSIAEAAEAYLRTGEAVELAMLRAAIGHLKRE